MSEHQYKFNVSMSCGGCSGAVERVLKKLDGQYRIRTLNSHPNHIRVVFPQLQYNHLLSLAYRPTDPPLYVIRRRQVFRCEP